MLSIILLTAFGIINLFVGFLRSNKAILPLVLLFLATVFAVNLMDWNMPVWTLPVKYANNMLLVNNYSVAFTAIMVLSTLLTLPFTSTYVNKSDAHLAEYLSLLLFALVGAIMMVSYENLLTLFLGIEIVSIAMYILAGSKKNSLLSNEASLKYFLMGAFATGILLFGIALLYGATGTFQITDMSAEVLINDPMRSPMLLMGLLLLLIGISFKVGAAPFHFWTPDVYEGTPTVFTLFMSTVVKTAGIAAFYKLLSSAFAGVYDFWAPTLTAITALTLVIGNIGAVAQGSVKRMLAYSSISHAGYLLMALCSLGASAKNAVFFYSLAYAIASVGAFGVLKLVADQRKDERYEAFNGLAKTNPLLAFVMTVSMCSLAGIPLTAGFFGKLFIFEAALDRDLVWLIVVAVLMAAVGIYYYFKPVIAMYMRDAEGQEAVQVDSLSGFTLLLSAILTILLGILPGMVTNIL